MLRISTNSDIGLYGPGMDKVGEEDPMLDYITLGLVPVLGPFFHFFGLLWTGAT